MPAKRRRAIVSTVQSIDSQDAIHDAEQSHQKQLLKRLGEIERQHHFLGVVSVNTQRISTPMPNSVFATSGIYAELHIATDIIWRQSEANEE